MDPSTHMHKTLETKRPDTAWYRAVAKMDQALGFLTEVPAAILVLFEILVLFGGVVSRYVIHRPLTWSDELASVMFLWLAMLGAVIAFRRSSHMRMTALVDLASPERRAFFDLLGVVAGATFLILVGYPAFEFAMDEAIVTSPSLEISNAWRASALPCGIMLMGISAILKFAEVSNWKRLLSALAVSACAVAASSVLSISKDIAEKYVGNFPGTWRRFEFKGKLSDGVFLYDDYAHHPLEITSSAFIFSSSLRTVAVPKIITD